jgi:hypothetical protein
LNLPIKNFLLACAGAALMTASAFAQGAIIRQGVTEAGGFLGASFGGEPTRIMGGGNVVYSLTRTFMPFGEVSYFRGVGQSTTAPLVGIPGATSTTNFSTPLTEFNAGFHLRVPIPRSRIIPYGVISVGAIHTPTRTIDTTATVSGTTCTTPFTVPSSTDFAVSGGGGIRYYTTERLGFRAEFKAYKAASGPLTNVFYRVAFGFFYQF